MKSASGKQLLRRLKAEGWVLLRVQGSHHILGKTGNTVRLVVPVHGSRPLKKGLLAHLLKVAGLPDQDP